MKLRSVRQPGADMMFEGHVIDAFSFLRELGFEVVNRCSSLVRYARGNVEVDVYQGRQSFEVGVGVTIDGSRFSLSELIRGQDPSMAETYRYPVATDEEGVVRAVTAVASMLKRYGAAALQGDGATTGLLIAQRREWAIALELDALAARTRPLADAAFKAGDYAQAAELYSRIRSRLSPAESARLALAEERSATRH